MTTPHKGAISISHINNLVERYKELLHLYASFGSLTPTEIFNGLFPESEEWSSPFRSSAKNILDDDDITLAKIRDTLLTHIIQPELPTDVPYIRVMSLHKSKGLTADHVIVTGCIEGLIPHTTRNDNVNISERQKLIEEQRRLFYVAITRPRKTLILSSVANLPRDLAHKMGAIVRGGGRTATTITSTFLSQLGLRRPPIVSGSNWVY